MQKECIAMLLAGGEGTRLGILTKERAKPAVPFGGKYRIIDFTLSNCVNSRIDTVGVLTQYQPLELNDYIGNGQPWDLDRIEGGVHILPPYQKRDAYDWYKGTANAITQNIPFMKQYNPTYVLILSGDHIYKMDYTFMLDYHKSKDAACTIAVIDVKPNEVCRFGIMRTKEDNSIYEFVEKPETSDSTKASMGIYIFNWDKLKYYLEQDETLANSSNDFGRNIIPAMISNQERIFAYPFKGYWKDVGTIESLWESTMDLLKTKDNIISTDKNWTIYSRSPILPPHYISSSARVTNSIISEGCTIEGTVDSSVIFYGVQIAKDSKIKNSVLMPGVKVGTGVTIYNAIIDENVVIGENTIIGKESDNGINSSSNVSVIGKGVVVLPNSKIETKSIIDINTKEVPK